MTLGQWIEHVDNAKKQYEEGAINAREYFNAVIFYAQGVELDEEE